MIMNQDLLTESFQFRHWTDQRVTVKRPTGKRFASERDALADANLVVAFVMFTFAGLALLALVMLVLG